MSIVVIEGPEPIVTPADVPGSHDGDDEFVAMLIAAAQGEIDGPTGWLGRALGVQTLELRQACWPSSLPYRPVIEILEVTVDGVPVEGVHAQRDGDLSAAGPLPRGETVIRYTAGYDPGRTGRMPPNARAAVILATNLLRSMSEGDIFVQQEQVNGVGTTSRNVTPYVAETIEKAVANLLTPLRVYG